MAETGRLRGSAAAGPLIGPVTLLRIAIILGVLALWEFIAHSGWLYRDVVPSLPAIARALFALLSVTADLSGPYHERVRRYYEHCRDNDLALAVAQTAMEYGGITPIGLPAGWPVLVDAAVAGTAQVVIGSGLRRSKLALAGKSLADLPGAVVIENLAR